MTPSMPVLKNCLSAGADASHALHLHSEPRPVPPLPVQLPPPVRPTGTADAAAHYSTIFNVPLPSIFPVQQLPAVCPEFRDCF